MVSFYELPAPKVLFHTPGFCAQGFPFLFLYNVTPDGNRFLAPAPLVAEALTRTAVRFTRRSIFVEHPNGINVELYETTQ
jgi:hypothetical protein